MPKIQKYHSIWWIRFTRVSIERYTGNQRTTCDSSPLTSWHLDLWTWVISTNITRIMYLLQHNNYSIPTGQIALCWISAVKFPHKKQPEKGRVCDSLHCSRCVQVCPSSSAPAAVMWIRSVKEHQPSPEEKLRLRFTEIWQTGFLSSFLV